MATYYIDFNGGNDANDGLSFANRKKTFDGLISANDDSSDNNSIAGNEYRVMGMPAVNTGVNATWTKGGFGQRDANNNSIPNYSINGATAGTPISISTNSAHGYSTGDMVWVRNVRGVYGANGGWVITVTGTNTFTLNNSSGTGTYIGVSNDYVSLINHRGIKVNTQCKRIALSSGTTYTDNDGHNSANNLYGVGSTNVTVNRRSWFSAIHNLRIQISNSFGTGKAWYYTLPETLDLSAYQRVSFHYQNRSDTRPNTSHLTLRLCTDTTGDTAAHTIQIPGMGSRGRYPIVEDFGTNLNSAIKSVALYVETDVGGEDLRFSNIIALKNTNDSISHQDVIGKNTTAEPVWWQCQYIQEDLMLFGHATAANNDTFGHANSDTNAVYTHQSETVALHKVTPFTMYRNGQDHQDAGYAHKFLVRPRYDGRRSSARTKVLGGWNTTDMSTQDSITWVNYYRYSGSFIYNGANGNVAFFDVEKFGMCGGSAVVQLRGDHYTVKDIYKAGFSEYTPIRFDNSYSWSGYTIDGIYQTMGNRHGFDVNSIGHCWTTERARFMFKNIYIYGTGEAQWGRFAAALITIENLNLYGQRWLLRDGVSGIGSKVIVKNLTASGFHYLHCEQDLRIHNSVIDNIVNEYYPQTVNNRGTTTENQISFRNFNGTTNDHRILRRNGCIKSETTVRHGTDGIAWRFEPRIEHTGNLSFSTTTNNEFGPFTLRVAELFVEANKEVTFKAYLRRTNTGLTIRLAARRHENENIFTLGSDVYANCTAAADTWQEVTLSVTPIDSGSLTINCEAFGGNSYSGYIDDISVTQAP